MAEFVFRAAAALALRRRQDEEAQRLLAAAEARRQAAARRLDAAREAMAATCSRGREEERRAGDLSVRVWYRNWIVGQRAAIDRCRAALADRERELQDATERAIVAHRRREALERFHDRARSAWQDAARRQEQKVIDELATMRHTRGRAGGRL
jgi:flagellar export protein FliJ